ncbi:MAG: carboxypeptidase regulatory-like domain-containing protein, partial [Chloroflexota bacterium]|nr:carboxypeptidase regulatory-like domain-containing protein [Chloroflexota bacterium]
PKFGIWPDGYYMSVNQFNGGTLTWGGAGVAAFERDRMLNGKVAQMIYFDVGAVTLDFGGMLPADLDGFRQPPDGSPNYFAEWDDSTQLGDPNDTLRLWEFHADWANPANSTFGLSGHAPNSLLTTADVDPNMCNFSRNCIPQPGTSNELDAISDRLMYRLQYRSWDGYETLVANHTVDADSTDHAGIHWIELHRRDDTWSIHQEGVYAPDTDHRWMGSIAMDHMGNIALGYSVASATTFPSIRYTGRLEGDPLGTMSQGEAELIAGNGSQTYFSNRWGDYSMMAVDPVDDCTFWYTQEYYQTNGYLWQTRIGSFKFPNCIAGPEGTLTGIVYEQGGTLTDPIAGASVWASLSPTQTFKINAGTDGRYTRLLPAGTYTVTAMAYGYQPNSVSAINITSDTTTTLDIPLTPVATHVLSGAVTDANTNWPLYAHITVQGDLVDPPAPYNDFWSDPVTGDYNITLAEGITYTFSVEAWAPEYRPTIRTVSPLTGDRTEDLAVAPDPTTCAAPGYSSDYAYSEDFEAHDGGYTHSGLNDEWEWGTPVIWPNGCVSGSKCWGTDLNGDYDNNTDQMLYSPVIDLSGIPTGTTMIAHWWQAWAIGSASSDPAFVEVSINGSLWTKIWSHTSGTTQMDWTEMSHDISDAAGGNVQFRWRLISSSYSNYEGLYVDDVTITAGCTPSAGGLVVGNVYDDNTDDPVVGANVTNNSGGTTTSQATPKDSAVEDAFYTLFSPASSHVFTATANLYGPKVVDVTVIQSDTIQQDIYLPAGHLIYTPPGLEITVDMGETEQSSFTLTNDGGWTAMFELQETDMGTTPLVAPLLFSQQSLPYERRSVTYWDTSETAPTATLGTMAANLWDTASPIPTGPRYRAAGTSCDGETYYVFGGWGNLGILDEAWRYDPAGDSWTALADMPVALMNFEAACIGDYIYLVGGYDGYAHTNDFQIYDIANDSWTLTTWPNVRTPMTAAWDGKLYALGGSPGPSDETWMYDPSTDTWTGHLAPMPTANTYGAAVTVGDYIYQIGGGPNNTVQRYDPTTDTWDDSGPQLQDSRMSALTVWYGDHIYVVSGGGAGFG